MCVFWEVPPMDEHHSSESNPSLEAGENNVAGYLGKKWPMAKVWLPF